MKKTIWISALGKKEDPAPIQRLHQIITQYGLDPIGHFWQDDLAQMAWTAPLDEISNPKVAMWMIVAKAQDLDSESIRYGLSCLAINVQNLKGHGFPIVIVLTSGETTPDRLATPLRGAQIVSIQNPGLGPKLAAKANIPASKSMPPYQLYIHAVVGIGQWYEVNPGTGHTWQGVLFGIDTGEITSHGTGSVGKLPEKAIVEYPMKGLEIQRGEVKYKAWAVKNTLSDQNGYFLGVKGYPKSILFGPLPEDNDLDVYVVELI